jgi:Tfp pilus assembly protein PilF
MSEVNFRLDEKFFEADQLIKENRIADAAILLNEIITEMPEYGRAHNHLGWIYETKFTDYNRAEKHYKAALQFTPEYPAVYYNYSILLSTLGRYDELVTLLEKAMLVPGINKATISNEYAIMFEAQGKYEQAIEYYKQYIRYLFDNKLIENAQASIQRCITKKSIISADINTAPGNTL